MEYGFRNVASAFNTLTTSIGPRRRDACGRITSNVWIYFVLTFWNIYVLVNLNYNIYNVWIFVVDQYILSVKKSVLLYEYRKEVVLVSCVGVK